MVAGRALEAGTCVEEASTAGDMLVPCTEVAGVPCSCHRQMFVTLLTLQNWPDKVVWRAGLHVTPDAACDANSGDADAAAIRDEAGDYSEDSAESSAPAALSDLPQMSATLAQSTRVARDTAHCLRGMAHLSKSLTGAERQALRRDPLIEQVCHTASVRAISATATCVPNELILGVCAWRRRVLLACWCTTIVFHRFDVAQPTCRFSTSCKHRYTSSQRSR